MKNNISININVSEKRDDDLNEIKRKRDKENFIKEYTKALENDTAAVFAGAGLSIPSGELSWKELLREEAKSIGLDVDRENDLILVAQYIFNEAGTRNIISSLIKNYIDKNGELNDNHKILADLPIKTYWTTNYDTYIERSLINKRIDIKRNTTDLALDIAEAECIVYKMHGDISIVNTAVLIKDDYEIYDKKNELFINKLRGDLLSKTFIFIGFSFEDPNLENILAKLRILLEDNPRMHYCFFRKINIKDFDNNEEYWYQLNKQELKINDLKRYGIKVILVKEYQEITKILQSIKKRLLSKRVFVSGAIEYYDESSYFKNYKRVDEFCQKLSERLYDEGYKIHTGMGLGVGRSIISGVLNKKYQEERKDFDKDLIINAFPNNIDKEFKAKYREELIKKCGNIIFLFGNKYENDEQVLSDGMQEEYEIAKKLELNIIPVGATGFEAKKIYELEKENLTEKLDKIIEDEKLIENIINCIKEKNK